MAGLALKSVMFGVEKIPDKWFDKVPGGYYRSKDKDDKGKKKKSRSGHSRRYSDSDRRYNDDDDGDDNASDDYDDRKDRRRHTRDYEEDEDDYSERNQRSRRARGHSVGASKEFDGSRYEEAPQGGEYAQARPYNPADYAAFGEEHYTSRQGGDGTRYVTPGFAAGAAGAHYMEPTRPSPSSGPVKTGYVPYAEIYGNNQHHQSGQTRSERESEYHPRSPRFQSAYQSDNPYASSSNSRGHYVESTSDSTRSRNSDKTRYPDRERRDSSRPRHKSRNRSRARSSAHEHFDTSGKGVGYGTMGALAGGLIGNEVGKGRFLPILTGAVTGGIGANAYENRDRAKSKGRRSSKYDDRHENHYDDRYENRHSRRDDDRYGSKDDYGRRNKRGSRHGGNYSD